MSKARWMVAGVTAFLFMSTSQEALAQSFHVDSVRVPGGGGTDYLTVDTATGRVFVSRATHVMVMDGVTGQIIGDIPNTPRVHGIALVPKVNRGFTTNGGDSTVSIFDLSTLAEVGRARIETGGLDGIMYDESSNRIVLTNHSRPRGTAVAIDPGSGGVVATAELEDDSPEGAASDGKGRVFVNNEGTSTMQVLDAATFAVKASWPLAPCEGPTGIAYDGKHQRIFVGCSDTSVVVDPASGKIVAKIANGDGVDALGWDPSERLIYIPAGRAGAVTVVHQDDADHYTVVATVTTFPGAKTVAVNSKTHTAYLFQPEYGPAPVPAPGTPPPAPGSRPPRGPVIGAWFLILRHSAIPPGSIPRQGAGLGGTVSAGAGRIRPASIRWYHISAGLGGIAAVSLLDRRVQRSSQNSRNSGRDDVAKLFRHAGQPEVYLPVALGTLAVGLIAKDDDVLRAGGRIAGSLALSGAVATLLKVSVGRTRPSFTTDPYHIHPFTKASSWPSGHASMAFSLASSVSDEIHSLPVSIGLYGIASMTAWSRINDNRHWLSDVVTGALIGITSTKFINGRWKVLGATGPRLLLGPGTVGVSLQLPPL